MRHCKIGVMVWTAALWAGIAAAENRASSDGVPERQQLADRLQRLETETVLLRSELQQLGQPVHLPHLEAASADPLQLGSGVELLPTADESPLLLDDLREEMKKLVWKKGNFTVVPYGVLWGNAIYATDRAVPGPFIMYIPSHQVEGEDTFEIDTRRTRLGLDVGGGKLPYGDSPTLSGRVEIDFHGTFSFANQPSLQLRHAYGEIKGENYRLLAGQTDDVIAPLNTGTLNYSVGWGAGNLGFRRMQIRADRYLKFSSTNMVTVTGSINQNIVRDFNTTSGIDPEAVDWPLVEARIGWTLGPRDKKDDPATFGVSGHIGEQGFDFELAPAADDVRIKTWSLSADMHLPITDRLGVQGEFFTGTNLSTFWGGIIQGVDLGTRKGIHTTGGWIEVWYDWTRDLHSHAGFSIDDPVNGNLTSPTGRTYNHYFFVNGIVDVTRDLQFGVEVSSWKTHYVALWPGESVLFEFMGMWKF